MSAQHDDLDAVRQISLTLEPFNSADRERILRWVREKLGMNVELAGPRDGSTIPPLTPNPAADSVASPGSKGSTDIRSFIQSKNPRSGNHLAVSVAYYHRFVAPAAQRKEAIGKDDILEACRLAEVKRPTAVAQVLVNAAGAGLLDRAGRGLYRVNAVGENLVAMVLPDKAEGNHLATARKTKAKGKHSS